MVISMESADYGKITFNVFVKSVERCNYIVLIDDKAPLKTHFFKNYIVCSFVLTSGKHIITIKSTPTNKNSFGFFKLDFFTSSQRSLFNHIISFHYDVCCFKYVLNTNIHRSTDLFIDLKPCLYYNFLNTKGSFTLPFVKSCSNLKINNEQIYCLFDKRIKKKFFRFHFFLFTTSIIILLLVLGLFAYFDFKNWASALSMGYTGKSVFWIGTVPVIFYVFISYPLYIKKLINFYYNDLDLME